MSCLLLNVCRSSKQVAEGMHVLGSPRAQQLPLHERELLNQVCGTLHTDVMVLVYSKLLLTESNRILAACTRQQETAKQQLPSLHNTQWLQQLWNHEKSCSM